MDNVEKKLYAIDHGWVGDPDCEGAGEDERLLIENREKVEILAEANDPDACYSYDDLVICFLEGHGYFLCQTSGCSCPSPSETWGVNGRFESRDEVLAALDAGEYSGYTLPDWAIKDLREQLSTPEGTPAA